MVFQKFQQKSRYPGARFYNAVVDNLNRTTLKSNFAGGSAADYITVDIVNKTGEDLPVFAVVELSAETINGETNNETVESKLNIGYLYDASKPTSDDAVIGVTTTPIENDAVGSAAISGIVTSKVDITDTVHQYAKPVIGDVEKLVSSESGTIRLVLEPKETGEKFIDVLLGVGATGEGVAPTVARGVIQEPCRRPCFRNAKPESFAEADDSIGWNVVACFGSIKLPGKTYKPVPATYKGGEEYETEEENEQGEIVTVTKKRKKGEQQKDEDGKPLYLKAREPRTGSGRFVLRYEGKTCNRIEWICSDGSRFPNDVPYPPKPFYPGFHFDNENEGEENNWPTTDDPENAQQDYDYALCRNLDWAELLIEGDEVDYQKQTADVEIEKTDEYGEIVYKKDEQGDDTDEPETETVRLAYYEVFPFDKFVTPVEGQAAVAMKIIEPIWPEEQTGDPESYETTDVDAQQQEQAEAPKFEAVYLELMNDHCTPKLVKTMGICNDCSSLRVRGVFIRSDVKHRRYPMMFELATLRVGGAIRSRIIDCYYKIENDECAPKSSQPEMTLERFNEWRLMLSSSVCAVTCTELVDPTSTGPPDP